MPSNIHTHLVLRFRNPRYRYPNGIKKMIPNQHQLIHPNKLLRSLCYQTGNTQEKSLSYKEISMFSPSTYLSSMNSWSTLSLLEVCMNIKFLNPLLIWSSFQWTWNFHATLDVHGKSTRYYQHYCDRSFVSESELHNEDVGIKNVFFLTKH